VSTDRRIYAFLSSARENRHRCTGSPVRERIAGLRENSSPAPASQYESVLDGFDHVLRPVIFYRAHFPQLAN
jgi:hypothetical protein